MQIATNEIVPLDAFGNAGTNSGKIVLLSLGVSNTTQEWASGDNVTHNGLCPPEVFPPEMLAVIEPRSGLPIGNTVRDDPKMAQGRECEF